MYSSPESSSSRFQSTLALADDVHHVWRSTLQPGETTPYEPDTVEFAAPGGAQEVDLANSQPHELPGSVRDISLGTAALGLSLLEIHAESRMPELSSMHVEKMAINLALVWEFNKSRMTAPNRDRNVEPEYLINRQQQYAEQIRDDRRIWILDKRLILASIATALDPERYPAWRERDDYEEFLATPGVQYYGEKGQRIVEAGRQGVSLKLGSEVDDLSEKYTV